MSSSKLYLLSITPLFSLCTLRAADAQPKPHGWQRKTFEAVCTVAGGYAGFKRLGIRGIALGAPGGYLSAKVAEGFCDDLYRMRADVERIQANEKRARILQRLTLPSGGLHPDFTKLLREYVDQQFILSALSTNNPYYGTPTERVRDFIFDAITDDQGNLDPDFLPDEDEKKKQANPLMDRLVTLICTNPKYSQQLRNAVNAQEAKDEGDQEDSGETA